MNQKRILNTTLVVIVIAIIAIGGYFILLKKSTTPAGIQPQQPTQQSDTSNWKTYRNEKYGFEIKYPPNLEPLEGKTLFYRPPELSSLLSVCFASVNRKEFYCEIELYIAPSFVASPQNLEFLNASSFLGLPRCSEERTRAQPKFDNVQGSEADTCEGESAHRNAFVTKDSFLYLISTEPSVGYYTVGKKEAFQEMINSFKFLK